MLYQNQNFNGNFDFRSKCHYGWTIEMHLHEYSEIVYCAEGTVDAYVNGKHIVLHKNEFIWLPPNYIHQYICPDATVICAVFSNDFIPLFQKTVGDKHLIVSAIDASDISYILHKLPSLKKEDNLLVSGYLNLIGSKVIENSEVEETRSIDSVLYQKVIFYISTHYLEDITLKQLAKKFGYNEKYLSHTLHDLTGIHFRRLLSLYRINRAKELLDADKSGNISDIALACGFSALNTFHRAFREATGMTPTEYKQSDIKPN